MPIVNHRGWNENLNRDEKDQEWSYQMNLVVVYCSNMREVAAPKIPRNASLCEIQPQKWNP